MTCKSFLLSVFLFVRLMHVSARHAMFLLHTKEVKDHCWQKQANRDQPAVRASRLINPHALHAAKILYQSHCIIPSPLTLSPLVAAYP